MRPAIAQPKLPVPCVTLAGSVCVILIFLFAGLNTVHAENVLRIEPGKSNGTSSAVTVREAALFHTKQFLPETDSSILKSLSAVAQLENVLNQIHVTLGHAGVSEIVKLNLYATDEATATEVLKALSAHFPDGKQPAVSMVVTRLPRPDAVIAADAVACSSGSEVPAWPRHADMAALPHGSRIYISGQAEQSESLAEATHKTLESLHRTLEFLGSTDNDVVQLKAFLQPMSDAGVVRAEIERFFGVKSVPPLVLVEWKSSSTTPIEIELIAAGGQPDADAPPMEFLTPPGMTASPIYCRVCRINHPTTVYVSGLFSGHDRVAHPDPSANGDIEVQDIFTSLDRVLKLAGSDFRHLAKATYYVSTDAASASLNKLRPQYYDPGRPPAASKAFVDSVGVKSLGLTIDMIAVPASSAP